MIGDDPLSRHALRTVLEAAGATVVAGVRGPQGPDAARRLSPDIALVDSLTEPTEAIETIKALSDLALGIRTILLAVTLDVEVSVAAIRGGARGHLRKADLLNSGLPRLLAAVMDGELLCSRSLVGEMVHRMARLPQLGSGYRPVTSPLTAREWEVLDRLCAGLSPHQIAGEFVISIETVRTHVKNLKRKLGAHSRSELIAATARLHPIN